MSNNTAYIITASDGSITLYHNSKSYLIAADHINYQTIKDALLTSEYDGLDELINVAKSIETATSGAVEVRHGNVFYAGNAVHGIIVDRILTFMRGGFPVQNLIKFLENLMQNPSKRSVDELYTFLEHGGFPITPDGCFMAYKGVTADFKDRHSQTVDNRPGSKPERKLRNQVCDDPNQACSVGYHVGTHSYANSFAGSDGRLLLVKVNPADVVSVPYDHSCEKLRVTYYEPIEECPDRKRLERPVYGENPDPQFYDNDTEDAYLAGYKACQTGEGSNPYENNDLSEAWHDGFNQAEIDNEETEEPSVDEGVEQSTGRRRGPGGRFLCF